MKKIFFTFLLLAVLPLKADIWKKPVYTPDENHLPSEEQQQQEEEIEANAKDKKHQDVNRPNDQIEKNANGKDLKEADLSGE